MGNPYVKSYQISKEMNKNNDIEFTSKNTLLKTHCSTAVIHTSNIIQANKLKSLKTLYCRLYIISMVSIINQMMNTDSLA
ncbi:hypothetical protein B0682_08090 [Moraxella lincolnii]|uniref:Uncharacterized protein n=1 Tax=Lwoffella lincolnii TaxID=90241 RepID=A0A1T0CC31_9GAMM|nr:hypothetical protein B0682_08090 [Moraxella lincolnii]